jgi:hypothetical protein
MCHFFSLTVNYHTGDTITLKNTRSEIQDRNHTSLYKKKIHSEEVPGTTTQRYTHQEHRWVGDVSIIL